MFNDLTKVQINPETKHVHLAIKISDNHVNNIIIDLPSFIKLVEQNQWGNGTWYMKRLKNHVKICNFDYSQHYRFSHDQWETIKTQFITQVKKLRQE